MPFHHTIHFLKLCLAGQ